MFHIFSIFNLNLEITAPECSIPDLSYALKWFFIQALPLGAAGIFLMLHLALLFKKRVLMGRRKRLNSHISSMVGMFFTMLYVLYLYLTRTGACVPCVCCGFRVLWWWRGGGVR